MSGFRKATKEQSKLRLALAGPAGSGKTFTALTLATALAESGPVGLVDTERGSASKYADLFAFDVLELESFHPQKYIDAIHDAEQAGYAVLVIDSLSHAWMGKDGALELVDRAAKRTQSGNSFGAWREVTPLHNALVDAMLGSNLHLIATMRSKQDYVQEKDDKGRTVIRKVGLAPVQRDGLEYEFDVYADLDAENNMIVGKTRCPTLAGQVYSKPGQQVADVLHAWLSTGEPAAPARPKAPPADEAKSQKRLQWENAYEALVDQCKQVGMVIPEEDCRSWDNAKLTERYHALDERFKKAKAVREAEQAEAGDLPR